MSFKKCQVVMLSTNEKADIGADNWYLKNTQKLIINNLVSYLYILSDDDIKDGDWMLVYNPILGQNHSIVKVKDIKQVVKGTGFQKYNQKIIATTDKFLVMKSDIVGGFSTNLCFPEPSESFIEVFVREYNKGNIITEVMVEYEEIWKSSVYDQPDEYIGEKLKLNPKDNTITIKKVKSSWNKHEITNLLKTFCIEYDILTNVDKWVEENL